MNDNGEAKPAVRLFAFIMRSFVDIAEIEKHTFVVGPKSSSTWPLTGEKALDAGCEQAGHKRFPR